MMRRISVASIVAALLVTACAFAPDDFADDLVVPEDLEVEYPVAWARAEPVPMSESEWFAIWEDNGEDWTAEERARLWVPSHKPVEITGRVLTVNDFVLYEGRAGPGTYGFDVWYIGEEPGTVQVSATEVTTQAELSKRDLREDSTIEVSASPGVATRYDSEWGLTIYEGNIGQPYAANFQVWFKAEGSDEDVLLVERVYVIEGWQH